MAAGKHGSSEITITYDDGPGGTPRAVTSYILTMGAVKLTSNMQASTAFGDTVAKMLPTGLMTIDQITLRGFCSRCGHLKIIEFKPGAVNVDPQSDIEKIVSRQRSGNRRRIGIKYDVQRVIVPVGEHPDSLC